MSGICGLLGLDSWQPTPGDLAPVLEGMRSRGPDGQESCAYGPMALGLQKLEASPAAAGNNVIWRHPKSGVVVTADARIDNRAEVLTCLGLQGRSQVDISDSELIARAYLEWGTECPAHLEGDFAFALWNPAEGQLFCARDPIGARSLYFVQKSEFFAFASVSEALLCLPGVSPRPNEDRLAGLLVIGFQPLGDRRSWNAEILALLAGESLLVDRGGKLKLTRYYRLGAGRTGRGGSLSESVESFREVFGKAIDARTQSVESPALMLSGGLDSAGLLAAWRRQDPGGEKLLSTFSVVQDESDDGEETRCINQMAALPGLKSHFLGIPSLNGPLAEQDMLDTMWSEAHPVDNSALLPVLMFRMAAAQGHRSILVGAAGDLTQLTPMRYLAPILRKLRFHQAWLGAVKASMNDVYQIGVSPTRIFRRNLYEAFLPAQLRLGIADFRRRSSGLPDSMINRDFAKRIGVEERFFALKSAAGLAAQRFGSDAGEQALTEHFTSALTGFGRMAARFGIESSDPWADRRVIELFLDLPLKWKTREGWTKYITRSAFEDDLPSSVIWRKDKQHLGAQLVERLMKASGPWLDEAFGPGLQFAEPYLDTNLLKSMYKQFRSEGEGSMKLAVDLAGWAALIFWLEHVNSSHLRTKRTS